MSEAKVIFQMEKNAGELLVIRESIIRGHRRLDLRTDFRDKVGEYHPTRKGVCLSADQWQSIIPAIQAAVEGMEVAMT